MAKSAVLKFFTLDIHNSRIFGLDLLRCIAILLVVTGHSVHLLPDPIKSYYLNLPLPDGVSVFFVLSGFLIGRILINLVCNKEISGIDLIDFWKRRWMRTLPAYYLVLIVVIGLASFFTEGFHVSIAYPYFIFSQNLFTVHPDFFIEAWSLSVEEWFYLLIPGLVFLLILQFKTQPKKAILITAFIIIAATIGVRYYRYLTVPVSDVRDWGGIFRGQVITRLDSIAFGLLASYVSIFFQQFWEQKKNFFLVVGLAANLAVAVVPAIWLKDSVFYHCNIYFIVSSISIMMLLPFLSQLKTAEGWASKAVTYTSLISYSMYLTHASVIIVFVLAKVSFFQSPDLSTIITRYVLFWILSYAIAFILYKYWELPFLELRDSKRKLTVTG